MSNLYGEPAEVRVRDDGRPIRFVWRSRLYVVHAILEHWVINREWWLEPEAEPGQPELEFWRVEAAPGHGVPPRLFELRRSPPAGPWTLRPHLPQAGSLVRDRMHQANAEHLGYAEILMAYILARRAEAQAVPRRCSM